MTAEDLTPVTWVERAVERSPAVQQSRMRITIQTRQILDSARKLIAVRGDGFTTQELAAAAGVALQTFYRYFASKDELLLALLSDAMTETCNGWAHEGNQIPDPLARLRFYLVASLDRLSGESQNAALSRFVMATRWRLHRHFPDELAEAEQPFVDLLCGAVADAAASGHLDPCDPQSDAWLLSELVRSVYHHYAFVEHTDAELDYAKQRLWSFSLAALGGHTAQQKGFPQ